MMSETTPNNNEEAAYFTARDLVADMLTQAAKPSPNKSKQRDLKAKMKVLPH